MEINSHEEGEGPLKTPEQETEPMFDVIIVMGSGIIERKYGKNKDLSRIEPGFEAKMRTLAAVEAYQQGLTRNLIFSGRETIPGMPAEARGMTDYVRSRFKEEEGPFKAIPEENMFEELEAWDASTNIKYCQELIEKHGWQNIGILTNDWMLERAEILAHNFGMEVEPISAEEKLIERDEKYRRVVERYSQRPDAAETKERERKLRLLLLIDRKGRVPRFLANRQRR